jgi:SagB-type dehydrogenase family enzyme
MRLLAFSLLATVMMAQEAAPVVQTVKLPAPATTGSFALNKALNERASKRNLTGPALSLEQLSQLLWSAQGENRPVQREGRPAPRTVPSAGARYPLELYVILANSSFLPEGVYKYTPGAHTLTKVKEGNPQSLLAPLPRMQRWIPSAPAVFIFAGVPDRMPGETRNAITYWESGAATQAMSLQVAALGLGATVITGVDLNAIHQALELPADQVITVILPVGRLSN